MLSWTRLHNTINSGMEQVHYLGKNSHFKHPIIIHKLQVLEYWVLGKIQEPKRDKLAWVTQKIT
jgi:hypothetical protein